MKRSALLAATVAVLATGCENPPVALTTGFVRDLTPHESHRFSIANRGLERTALGSQWLEESDRALAEPVTIRAPHFEDGHFVKPEADAVGYRVRVERGKKLELRVEGELFETGNLFVDVFEAGPDGSDPMRRLGTPEGGRMELQPDSTTDYVVRIQPPIFAEGEYRLALRTVPALLFPVAGRDNSHVWSRFGAERDGGAREHHGVDIFAPRGTPVLASTEAVVRRVDETPIGGKVVWLRDRERGHSIYYAHLDSQLVRDGQRVSPGDTLGLVGNSGNAVTTPPHLHFGLYVRRRGPIDPFPFIELFPTDLPDVVADRAVAGAVLRAGADGARVRSQPSLSGDVLAELDGDQPFRVVAATGGWYRVRLPDGTEGFVAERVTVDPGLGRIAMAAVESPDPEPAVDPPATPTVPEPATRNASVDAQAAAPSGGVPSSR